MSLLVIKEGRGRGEGGEKRGGKSERGDRKREKVGEMRKGKVTYDYGCDGVKSMIIPMIVAARGWK